MNIILSIAIGFFVGAFFGGIGMAILVSKKEDSERR
jgi:hypothetical protein